jgi:hypothetical protein
VEGLEEKKDYESFLKTIEEPLSVAVDDVNGLTENISKSLTSIQKFLKRQKGTPSIQKAFEDDVENLKESLAMANKIKDFVQKVFWDKLPEPKGGSIRRSPARFDEFKASRRLRRSRFSR